jgi:hypothetical protein
MNREKTPEDLQGHPTCSSGTYAIDADTNQ